MRLTPILTIVVCIAGTASAQESPARDYAPLPEYRVFGTPASPEDARAITELMASFSRAGGGHREGSGLRRAHITCALAKRDGEWRIAHQMIMDARR